MEWLKWNINGINVLYNPTEDSSTISFNKLQNISLSGKLYTNYLYAKEEHNFNLVLWDDKATSIVSSYNVNRAYNHFTYVSIVMKYYFSQGNIVDVYDYKFSFIKSVAFNSVDYIVGMTYNLNTSRLYVLGLVNGNSYVLYECDWDLNILTVNNLIFDNIYPINSATFSRSSIAYKSDGTQVAANVPRYEAGKFGQAVMVEEGTTNLVGNPSFETDTTGWTLGPAFARSNAAALFSSYSLALTNPAGAQESDYFVTVSPNTTYTVSCYVKNGLNVGVRMDVEQWDSTNTPIRWDVDSVSASASSSTWVRLVKTVTTLSNAAKIRVRLITDAGGTGTAYWDGVQVEQKPYATSFIDGTRSPETLTIPTAGVLNPQEGTIEFWLNPQSLDLNTYVCVGGTPWVSASEDNNSYQIYREEGTLKARWGNGSGVVLVDSALALTIGMWFYVAVTWKANDSLKIYVNGTLKASATLGSLNPVYPTNYIWVGIDRKGNHGAQSLIDDLRISSRARTDKEILQAYQSNQPLPVDEYTTYKLNFNNSLQANNVYLEGLGINTVNNKLYTFDVRGRVYTIDLVGNTITPVFTTDDFATNINNNLSPYKAFKIDSYYAFFINKFKKEIYQVDVDRAIIVNTFEISTIDNFKDLSFDIFNKYFYVLVDGYLYKFYWNQVNQFLYELENSLASKDILIITDDLGKSFGFYVKSYSIEHKRQEHNKPYYVISLKGKIV